jgi:myo-inositol-1(or 4)-monophosphatase
VTDILLSEIEALARDAGALLRAGFWREKHVFFKGSIDLVTDVDRQAEEFIIQKILASHPGHRIVAEESGETTGKASSTWYVDPMDGTVNFSHGFPFFCVSIGYAENGVMRYGVVYDPIRDECFSAERGRGAWLNSEPIRSSQNTDLNTSLLATEFGYDIRTHPQNNLAQYSYFSLHTLGVRRIGSAALDLCNVACGRVDGYWELRVKPWDLAAGGLIAEEAGAKVTKISGEPDYVTSPCSILAAPEALHAQMQEIIWKLLA